MARGTCSGKLRALERRDWFEWHSKYDDPGSGLGKRLAVVQSLVRTALDGMPPGPARAVSLCAGQGRDLLEVLASHPRRGDVSARLVELDERNVEVARAAAAALGLTGVDAVVADAGTTDAYDGAVPANVVLVCGVFGNVSDEDIESTIRFLPQLCAAEGVVVWTRHRHPPDRTPLIRAAFARSGFTELAFETDADALFGVGAHRLRAALVPLQPGRRLFSFVR